jgi:hypothetical protein
MGEPARGLVFIGGSKLSFAITTSDSGFNAYFLG